MEQLKALLTQNQIPYREEEPLSNHTTFKIGGPCPLYILPETQQQLALVLNALRKMQQEFLVIGNGSNLLVSDQGTQMVVIRLSGEFTQIEPTEHGLAAGGGAQLSALCKKAAELSFTGLEFAYGIPGSIGGAVYMNAGAYGGEMKDVLDYVQVMDAAGKHPGTDPGRSEDGLPHQRFAASNRGADPGGVPPFPRESAGDPG